MRNIILLIVSFVLVSDAIAQQDSILLKMKEFINGEGPNAGLLFGNCINGKISLWTVGAINKDNDLRVACPTTKPIICYLILKSGIDINTPISRWFPETDGYTMSGLITVKMLMLNSSGIQDYVRFVLSNPDSAISVKQTIDLAYRNKELLFRPGESWEYSNTNFNLLGLILEKELRMPFEEIVRNNFHAIAPSLRMDSGKANYPAGFVNPWPYHWSAPGFAGGLICTAEDAIKVFEYISKQKEFGVMSASYNTDGTLSTTDRWGLGVYLSANFNGLGRAIYYDGNMGACKMDIFLINNKIYYFYAPYSCEKGLKDIETELIFK